MKKLPVPGAMVKVLTAWLIDDTNFVVVRDTVCSIVSITHKQRKAATDICVVFFTLDGHLCMCKFWLRGSRQSLLSICTFLCHHFEVIP